MGYSTNVSFSNLLWVGLDDIRTITATGMQAYSQKKKELKLDFFHTCRISVLQVCLEGAVSGILEIKR
jgi:hypothetical protein